MPPAEPPANEIFDGSAFIRSTRSFRSRISDSARTTIASGSEVNAAISVVSSMSSGAWLVSIAPSITRPMTIIWFASPLRLAASCARPIVPPAPVTL